MEYVEPIRQIEKIKIMKLYLRKRSKRDYLLFILGINTGLRISQMLELKCKDVFHNNTPREFLIQTDCEETYLNHKVKQAILHYLKHSKLHTDDFLFSASNKKQPITRQQAYRIINQAAQEAGICDKIGTHTLRKTFGYHAYKQGIAVSFLQKRFNHKTRGATLRYIGITDEINQPPQIDVNL